MATAYPGGLRKRGGLLDNEDTIQATPRNPFFGGVADLLGQAYKLPEMPRMGVPGLDFVAANRNRLLDMLGVGDVQKTAETMSYGGRLGTGAGMTYRPLPETIGAAMTVAPFAGKAIRATEGLPVGASIKAIGDVAPQAEAMRLAQQRAALPVEQGGLGLPATNTAMDRAKAMGAEDVYHGTNAEKQILNNLNFNLDADQRNVGGIWTTKDKNYASWLADQKDRNNANVMSLKLLNAKNSYEYDILQEGIKLADEIGVPIPKNPLEAQELLSGGYGWDRVVGDLLSESKLPNLKITNFNDAYHSNPNEVTTAFITKDPSLLRLSNAAFDPFRKTAATAAAMGVAAPDLLAAPLSVADQKLAILYDKYNGDAEAAVNEMMRGVYNTPKEKEAIRQVFLKQLQTPQTRNFVVFPGEEKSMTILERNAQKADELKRLQAGGLLAP